MSTRKTLKTLVNARRGAIVPGAFNALSAQASIEPTSASRPSTSPAPASPTCGSACPTRASWAWHEIAEATTARIRDAVDACR